MQDVEVNYEMCVHGSLSKGGEGGDIQGGCEGADKGRFFTFGWGEDKADKVDKVTRKENSTKFGSVVKNPRC
jgi:hypothetical protein